MAKYKNKQAFWWKFKRFVKNHFLLDFMALFSFILEKTHKKDNNRLLYFFQMGEGFSDNSKYLFEYLDKNSTYKQVLFVVDYKLYINLVKIYSDNTIYWR